MLCTPFAGKNHLLWHFKILTFVLLSFSITNRKRRKSVERLEKENQRANNIEYICLLSWLDWVFVWFFYICDQKRLKNMLKHPKKMIWSNKWQAITHLLVKIHNIQTLKVKSTVPPHFNLWLVLSLKLTRISTKERICSVVVCYYWIISLIMWGIPRFCWIIFHISDVILGQNFVFGKT